MVTASVMSTGRGGGGGSGGGGGRWGAGDLMRPGYCTGS